MKLENLPVSWSIPAISDMNEYEMAEFYDGILSASDSYRRLYIRPDELPDIVVEAGAFRVGCVDHETFEFGWCPGEVDDPGSFPRIRRFVERAGQRDLAAAIHAFEVALSAFDLEDVAAFLGQSGTLPPSTSEAINDLLVRGFGKVEFSDGIWVQAAHAGAEKIRDSNAFCQHSDPEEMKAAQRRIVDALPDYENRKPQQTIWSVDLPFHQLLVSVGERYFNDESLKITRRDGTLFFRRPVQSTCFHPQNANGFAASGVGQPGWLTRRPGTRWHP